MSARASTAMTSSRGGNDQDACVEIAKYLEPYVDYFNVSCGVYASAATMIEPCYSPEGWRSGFVKAIKSQVSVPVIAVNTVKHPQFAEQLLQEGVSDFVGMSRMHIADPYLVQKAMAGREDLIRKCLGCMNCNKSVVAGRTLHCALNPIAGHEVTFGDDKLVKNGNGRKVAIVGGGPAGMQAALLMKKRGFEPVIFEASGTLGGSAILASRRLASTWRRNSWTRRSPRCRNTASRCTSTRRARSRVFRRSSRTASWSPAAATRSFPRSPALIATTFIILKMSCSARYGLPAKDRRDRRRPCRPRGRALSVRRQPGHGRRDAEGSRHVHLSHGEV